MLKFHIGLLLVMILFFSIHCKKPKKISKLKPKEVSKLKTISIQNKIFFVKVFALNVRLQSNLKSSIVHTIKFNTKVTAIMHTEDKSKINDMEDYWFKIKTNKVQGWVFGGYIQSEDTFHPPDVLYENGLKYERTNLNLALNYYRYLIKHYPNSETTWDPPYDEGYLDQQAKKRLDVIRCKRTKKYPSIVNKQKLLVDLHKLLSEKKWNQIEKLLYCDFFVGIEASDVINSGTPKSLIHLLKLVLEDINVLDKKFVIKDKFDREVILFKNDSYDYYFEVINDKENYLLSGFITNDKKLR